MSAQTHLQVAPSVQACLRVTLDAAKASPQLEGLVGKLVAAFLESRWAWPRYFERAAPGAFLLADPRTAKVDLEELQHLALELQSKLFGVEGAGGGVDLLVFEGEEVEIHRFARLESGALRQMLLGEGDDPLQGQISRILPGGVTPVSLPPPPAPASGAASALMNRMKAPPDPSRRYEPMFRGSYFVPEGRFIGSTLYLKPFGASTARALLDRPQVIAGISAEEYDEACVKAAVATLSAQTAPGHLMTPLSFSSLVRPAGRTAYAAFLHDLAPFRDRAAVAVYDTPRKPIFFTISQVVAFLTPYFSRISLMVSDPDFGVDQAPPGIHSVSFVLPEADGALRLAAVRHFGGHLPDYRRRRIWPVIDGVKTHAELNVCIAGRIPFISGPAVSDLMAAPVAGRRHPVESLPLREG